jgi:LPS O-antigen subunit length determinant protein (WzzB/FepE family)
VKQTPVTIISNLTQRQINNIKKKKNDDEKKKREYKEQKWEVLKHKMELAVKYANKFKVQEPTVQEPTVQEPTVQEPTVQDIVD